MKEEKLEEKKKKWTLNIDHFSQGKINNHFH